MRQGCQKLLEAYVLTPVNLGKRLDQFVFVLGAEGETLVCATGQNRDTASLGKRNALDYDTTFYDCSGDELHRRSLARGGTGLLALTPNVRAKLPAEAGAVSLVRDDAPSAADQAYSACRSGSA